MDAASLSRSTRLVLPMVCGALFLSNTPSGSVNAVAFRMVDNSISVGAEIEVMLLNIRYRVLERVSVERYNLKRATKGA